MFGEVSNVKFARASNPGFADFRSVPPPAIAALLFLISSLRAHLDSLQDAADGPRSLRLTVRPASVGAAVGYVARHTSALQDSPLRGIQKRHSQQTFDDHLVAPVRTVSV